jgi:hypothetical protein
MAGTIISINNNVQCLRVIIKPCDTLNWIGMIHETHKYDNQWTNSPTSAVSIIELGDTK